MELLDLFVRLRQQPERYIGRRSLGRLRMFVLGFVVAREGLGIVGENEFLLDFDEWLRQRFGATSQNGESIVLFEAEYDDRAAFDAFWPLFSEFVQSREEWLQWQEQRPSATPVQSRVGMDELLRELRARAALYLAHVTLSRMLPFLKGFAFGIEQGSDGVPGSMLREFEDWVRCHYGFTSRHSAEAVIRFHSVSDIDAVDLFWKLFDVFEGEGVKRGGS